MTKKQKKEELLKTHVININEIREAERYEKNIKSKKIAVIFIVIGLMFIGTGSAINRFVNESDDNKKVVVNTRKSSNGMSCISNVLDNENNLKVYTKTVYNFDNNNVVVNSNSLSEITLLNNQTNLVNELKNKYSEIYKSSNGVTYNITVRNNTLYFSTTVSNYNLFDYSAYNNEIDTITSSKMFRRGSKKDYIKKTLEKMGSLCS